METRQVPPRRDGRMILHFDHDCFYAAVFEARNPSLKSLPFAVQQKHILATCNYEARRRGLYKLMLVRDAKRVCPDVIIELGEDLTRFRDASKELYNFIKGFSWDGKLERLGFDEVWMDVTTMIDYNMETLNRHDLGHSFFQLSRQDPTQGFTFDASSLAGCSYPKELKASPDTDGSLEELRLRHVLGSHLALYMRHQLEEQKGYTSTVGIATNKLLSKLVGTLNKPKAQTTLMPPLSDTELGVGNAITFMDDLEIGKVPGIGFKLAQKLRQFILQHPAEYDFTHGGAQEQVTVLRVRNHPDVNFEKLENLLGGPGSPHGIGYKVWCLIHGIDDTEVSKARPVPRQISIEDSYLRLDTMPELLKELDALARSLIKRMRIDLLGDEEEYVESKQEGEDEVVEGAVSSLASKKWLAHPKTLRLTTRPRLPLRADGTRERTMKRISHSCPLPNFVFNLSESVDAVAEKLVHETLLHMFRRLHPEKLGWNLSLVNIAVTNMAEAAGESKTANGRDIGNMFKRQDDVLKDFRVVEGSPERSTSGNDVDGVDGDGVHEVPNPLEDDDSDEGWHDGDDFGNATEYCYVCSSHIPSFAMVAHQRFHSPDNG